MNKSAKYFNLIQVNKYLVNGAKIIEVGKEFSDKYEKVLFWVRFDIDDENYIKSKDEWNSK